MAHGRGNSAMMALMLLFSMLMFHSEMAYAATYTVGDANGWTFNVAGWPNGKRFKAGDILVFNYNPSLHNLVVVNGAEYNACTTSTRDRVYQSGHDHIQLPPGQSYFICSIPGHCQGGMKIAINAG